MRLCITCAAPCCAVKRWDIPDFIHPQGETGFSDAPDDKQALQAAGLIFAWCVVSVLALTLNPSPVQTWRPACFVCERRLRPQCRQSASLGYGRRGGSAIINTGTRPTYCWIRALFQLICNEPIAQSSARGKGQELMRWWTVLTPILRTHLKGRCWAWKRRTNRNKKGWRPWQNRALNCDINKLLLYVIFSLITCVMFTYPSLLIILAGCLLWVKLLIQVPYPRMHLPSSLLGSIECWTSQVLHGAGQPGAVGWGLIWAELCYTCSF